MKEQCIFLKHYVLGILKEKHCLFAARKREILTEDKTTKSQSNRQKLCAGQMKGHLRIPLKA